MCAQYVYENMKFTIPLNVWRFIYVSQRKGAVKYLFWNCSNQCSLRRRLKGFRKYLYKFELFLLLSVVWFRRGLERQFILQYVVFMRAFFAAAMCALVFSAADRNKKRYASSQTGCVPNSCATKEIDAHNLHL